MDKPLLPTLDYHISIQTIGNLVMKLGDVSYSGNMVKT